VIKDICHIWILKAGFIPDDPNYRNRSQSNANSILKGHPFSTSSVDSLLSYDIWCMGKDSDLKDVWSACEAASDLTVDSSNEDLKIAFTPHDLNTKQFSRFDFEKLAHVVVDLTATDEQIKYDFNHWLTHIRQALNCQRPKKLFTRADFDRWVELGIIPYLDLVLIAKIEGKKIKQNQLGKLIFPNDLTVDVVERIRKSTKPLAERLMNTEIHRLLSIQLTYEKILEQKTSKIIPD
jgi:hypothetical protein